MNVGYLRLQTYTHNTYYLLLSHNNNGCTNASQCYVIRTVPVFLSHKVVKLARVWQLKIVPAAGENSIVTGSAKWGLLFDFFFAQSNHERHDRLQCTVRREPSLWLIVRSNETGNEHKTVVYRRAMELTRTATVFVWLGSTSRHPVFDASSWGTCCCQWSVDDCVFWWRLRINELMNKAGDFTCIYTHVFRRLGRISDGNCLRLVGFNIETSRFWR